ncbi:MAG: DUF5693 family protein [Eubacteriales bacterium]|nr:DUF5693 family protein [Eubacteriales bacterium]
MRNVAESKNNAVLFCAGGHEEPFTEIDFGLLHSYGINAVAISPISPVYIDHDVINKIKGAGLEVVLRIPGRLPAQTSADIVNRHGIKCVILDALEEAPPGDYCDMLADFSDSGVFIGLIEGEKQTGFVNDEYIAGFIENNCPAAVRKVFDAGNTGYINDPASALYIWLRSIVDRGNRIIIVSTPDLEGNNNSGEGLLESRGYKRASSSADLTPYIPEQRGTDPLIPAAVFLLLSFSIILFYFSIRSKLRDLGRIYGLNVTEDKLPVSWLHAGFVFTAAGLFFLPPGEIAVLAVTLFFPFFAATALMLSSTNTSGRPSANVLTAAASFAAYILLSLFGGLMSASVLSGFRYASGAGIYLGTYLSFTGPLLLSALFYAEYSSICSSISRITGCQCLSIRGRGSRSIYFTRLLFRAVSISALAAVLYIYLSRSGNHSILPAWPSEIRVRESLEYLLPVRPRFKEFLVAYPCAFLFLCPVSGRQGRMIPPGMIYKSKSGFYLRLLLISGITAGSISIINSFCHGFTPLSVSFSRTLSGIFIGVFICFIPVVFYKLFRFARGRSQRVK